MTTTAQLSEALAILDHASATTITVREVRGILYLVVWVSAPCKVTPEECKRLGALNWEDHGSTWRKEMR